ncbi:MAG TPA: hypothetical protein VNA28_14865 [Solirubrobacteraceae bacterium]|nr:hypothetical protein [Solirubrobacteraceae bacterium]
MKLRQKSKRDQALDATASIAKTWSEWRLGEKVAQSATKAGKGASKVSKKAKKHSSGKSKRRPAMIAGAIALVGGIGAAAAKKFMGGKAEPLYTPPGPAPDMAPPPASPVAVEDLTRDPPLDRSTMAGTSVPSTLEPAATASTEVPERDPSPVVVGDLADEAEGSQSTPEMTAAPLGSEEPAAAPPAEDHPPSADLAPVPEDLVSHAADPAPADDEDEDEDDEDDKRA